MSKIILSSILTAALLAPALAFAAPAPKADETVAGAFMAAAQTQDRKATVALLDEKVAIHFPSQTGEARHGQGQPFVIGYMDGLFDAQGVSLDGPAAARGEAVRFLAHDMRSNDRYAIDVQVRDQRVVAVTVNRQTARSASKALAALD